MGVVEDRDGHLFVGTGTGVFLFDPQTRTAQRWPVGAQQVVSSRVYDLYLDQDQTLWSIDESRVLPTRA